MIRSAVLALLLLVGAGATATAQDREGVNEEETFGANVRREGFVVMSDACGASRYADLIGRDYGEVTEASLLPTDSVLQNRNMLRTLEYTPHKLNVAVGADGRIIAIGCF